MKRTLVYGTATAIIAASLGGNFGLARCGRTEPDPIEGVYGPPIEVPYDEDEPVEAVYGPPPDEYDEPIEDVYGPPVEIEEETIEVEQEPIETDTVQPALYGPPAN